MSSLIKKTTIAITTALVALSLVSQTAIGQTQSNQPTLEILTPKEGQTIYGDKLPILFNVTNFQLTDPQKSPTPQTGQGHINVWIDDSNPTADSATKVSNDNYTFSDVSNGSHTLKAELVGNDNSPLSPPVTLTVNFTTAALTQPDAPKETVFDKNTALIILVVVALVIVAAWWYTKEDDEEEKPSSKTKAKKPAQKPAKKKPAGRSKRK